MLLSLKRDMQHITRGLPCSRQRALPIFKQHGER